LRDSDGWDHLIAKRKDDVSGRHLAHILVESIARTVLVPLRGPKIPAAELLFERLVLVDPPEAHDGTKPNAPSAVQ
jgi:hypothetical protein